MASQEPEVSPPARVEQTHYGASGGDPGNTE